MLLVCDVDGVMTDGKAYYGHSSRWGDLGIPVVTISRQFSMRDGYGIRVWCEAGHEFLMISMSSGADLQARFGALREAAFLFSEDGEAVTNRINLATGVADKLAYVKRTHPNQPYAAIADDVADIPLLWNAEYAACPNDAHYDVLLAVGDRHQGYVLENNGGDHCVREAIDRLLYALNC